LINQEQKSPGGASSKVVISKQVLDGIGGLACLLWNGVVLDIY